MKNMQPFPQNSNIAAYLRDSGGDEQDLSVEQQEAVIQQWAAQNGYVLTRIYKDEARTGTTTVGRDQFDQMINHLTSQESTETGLVIWKFNRFGRNYNDSQYYKAYLRRNGITIHSLNDRIPPGEDGLFFESAIDWMNARFSRDLSVDVKRGLYHNLHQYGAVPGSPPRGFKRTPVDLGHYRNGKPHIVHRWDPDPELAPLVLKAYQMRVAGESYTRISDATSLYTTKTGWQHFFSNPLYKGEMHYGDQVITDYCDAIVPQELWKKVQIMQEKKPLTGNNRHPRRISSQYILSGIAHCAQCGSNLNGETVTNRKKNITNQYYACTLKKRSAGKECNSLNIPKQAFEEAIIHEVSNHIITVENLTNIRDKLKTDSQRRLKELGLQHKTNQKNLTRLNRQIQNIVNAIAAAGHSAALLENLKNLELQAQETSARNSRIEDEIVHLRNLPDDRTLTITSTQISQVLQSANQGTKKTILQALIQRIDAKITPERTLAGVIYYYLPGEIMSMGISHRGEGAHRRNFFIALPITKGSRAAKYRNKPP